MGTSKYINLIKIEPDKEKAKALFSLSEKRLSKIKFYDEEKESELALEAYYESAKELITAIMFSCGWKSLGHEEMIIYLKQNYPEFQEWETELLNQMRIKRNRIVYEGAGIDPSYLKRNRAGILGIIRKLKEIAKSKFT
jgi:hypothetical protein